MASQPATKSDYGAAPLGLNVTRDLAAFLARFRFEDLPEAAVHEARRGVLDWIGCALAGSRTRPSGSCSPVLKALGRAAAGDGARPQAQARPDSKRRSPTARWAMCSTSTTPTWAASCCIRVSPVLAALFALAERGADERRAPSCCAYAAGFEAGVRVGQSAPGHHDGGWHLTGTLGTIAAGAACGKLLGLDAQQMTLRARHRRDAGGRHAAEPRHHVQVVPRRQGRVERAARRAAGTSAASNCVGGDRRGQARLLPHLQQRRQARAGRSTGSARAGRSSATATSPMPAAWCCIR